MFTPLEYGCCGLSEEKAIEIYKKENLEVRLCFIYFLKNLFYLPVYSVTLFCHFASYFNGYIIRNQPILEKLNNLNLVFLAN